MRAGFIPSGLRADDFVFHDDLYWNVLTCIHGCDLGIAIFDRVESNILNPKQVVCRPWSTTQEEGACSARQPPAANSFAVS